MVEHRVYTAGVVGSSPAGPTWTIPPPTSAPAGDVVAALESLYPLESAADWDRVGLVTGDLDQPVRRILFALDPTLAVIDEAREWGADLLVTHHPLLLRGVHSVATTSAKGASVTGLVRAGIALWVGHTNADVADPGVSTVLADALGLADQRPLSTEGAYASAGSGVLAAPVSLADFADARGRGPAGDGRRHTGQRRPGRRRCARSRSWAARATTASTTCVPAAPTSTSPPTCATTRSSRRGRRRGTADRTSSTRGTGRRSRCGWRAPASGCCRRWSRSSGAD